MHSRHCHRSEENKINTGHISTFIELTFSKSCPALKPKQNNETEKLGSSWSVMGSSVSPTPVCPAWSAVGW